LSFGKNKRHNLILENNCNKCLQTTAARNWKL